MRIVTWNLGRSRGTHEAAWHYLLTSLKPDVACVQEALGSADRLVAETGAVRQSSSAVRLSAVDKERSLLPTLNKFKALLDQMQADLPPDIKEDLDTHFAGIISIIRTFRNQSGHPTGQIIDRKQAYVLPNLFVPYCKKMYQLIEFFRKQRANNFAPVGR